MIQLIQIFSKNSFRKNFLGIFLIFSLKFYYSISNSFFIRTFFQTNSILFQSFQNKSFFFYIFCFSNQIKKKLMENQRKFSQFNKSFGFGNILILKHFEDPPWFKKKDKSYGLFSFNFSFQRLKVLLKNFEQKKKSKEKDFFFFQRIGRGFEKNFNWFFDLEKFNKKQSCIDCLFPFQIDGFEFIKKKNLRTENSFFLKENPYKLMEIYKTKNSNFINKKKLPVFFEQKILFIMKIFENKKRNNLNRSILKKTAKSYKSLFSKPITSRIFFIKTESKFVRSFSGISLEKNFQINGVFKKKNFLFFFLRGIFLENFYQSKQRSMKCGEILSLLQFLIYKMNKFKMNKFNIKK